MKVVVLTGAGVSAESGLPTFRDTDLSTGSGQRALWEARFDRLDALVEGQDDE